MKTASFGIVTLALVLTIGCGAPKPQASTVSTTGPTATVQQAETLIDQGDFKGGLAVLQKVTAAHPNDAKVHYYIGLCYQSLGQLAEAIGSYKQALQLDGHLVEAMVNLGLAELDSGQSARAVTHFQQAAALEPDAADVHYNLGIAQLASNALDEADAELDKAIQIDSTDPDFLVAKGDVARARHQAAKALGHYQAALKMNPAHVGARFSAVSLLFGQKKAKAAIKLMLEIVNQEVDSRTLTSAGLLLVKNGAAAEATRLYDAAIKADPDYMKPRMLLGNLYARAKKWSLANESFEAAAAVATDPAEKQQAQKAAAACAAHL